MALAIFDLDETLIAGDSCTLFCEFLIAEGFAPKSFLRQDAQMMALYNSEKLVLSEYIQFLIEPLSHLSTAEIDALLPGFVERYVVPRIYPQGLQTLADFKQQGFRPLIISATADFIVKAVAKQLEVSDVLAIQLVSQDDRYTGDIDGVPTFREGKVTRLKNWLIEQQESIDGAYFHSDSINDLALLEQVEYPVAANPDRQLQAIAKERNWPVLNWTAPTVQNSTTPTSQPFLRQEHNHV
ncbi:MAG: HAD family hydrolase [Amphritea sp.]|nr:HAD family hydrolase [Amphritea sp.]MBQ0784307.1 HAD family hydrolase [Amphritea sp.]